MINQANLAGLKPREPEPNPFDTVTDDLKQLVTDAKEILVLIRENPRLDHVASGLALFLSLKNAGKSVTIACATQMRVEFNRLVGVNKINPTIGNRNLVISFPSVKDSIEKVSYNVDEANFNLVIQPKPSFPALDSSKIQYSYSGSEADLVFVIGAQKLEDLGVLYQSERQLFDTAKIVNIDSIPTNTKFAPINLIWSEFSSTAEVVTQLIERLGMKLDQDIATNLLAGVNDATQNFQRFNVKAQTFEVAAKLMQAGGRRPINAPSFAGTGRLGSPLTNLPGRQAPAGTWPRPSLSTRPLGQTAPLSAPVSSLQPQTQIPPQQSAPPQVAPATPAGQLPPLQPQADRPLDEASPLPPAPASSLLGSQPTQNQPPQQGNDPNQPVKADWLKPKIYKGSTKV